MAQGLGWTCTAAVVCLGLAGPARCDTVTQFAPVADATLIEPVNADLANGAGDGIYVGVTQRAGLRRGLLRFDVSSLPADAVVVAVSLRLTLDRSRPEPTLLRLHRGLQDWGEAGSVAFGGNGAPALPGDATWLWRRVGEVPAQAWDTPGGSFAPQPSASVAVAPVEGQDLVVTGAGMVADVQAWLNQPAQNHGWTLLDEPASSAKKYASREHPVPAWRPQLSVTWRAAAASTASDGDVPLPAWALLLLAGALGQGLRRRARRA